MDQESKIEKVIDILRITPIDPSHKGCTKLDTFLRQLSFPEEKLLWGASVILPIVLDDFCLTIVYVVTREFFDSEKLYRTIEESNLVQRFHSSVGHCYRYEKLQ